MRVQREKDKNSQPTSQEEYEKSPDSHERSSPNLIPLSPNAKSPANKRREIAKSVPVCRKQPTQRNQPVGRKHVHHDKQKGQLQSNISTASLQPQPKYSSSTLPHKVGNVSVQDNTTTDTCTLPATDHHDKSETPLPSTPVAQEHILVL